MLTDDEEARTRGAEPLLTDDEHEVIRLLAEAWNLLNQCAGSGRTRAADMGEAALHVHALQHAVMAQAAARAYPDIYRLLGEPGRNTPTAAQARPEHNHAPEIDCWERCPVYQRRHPKPTLPDPGKVGDTTL